MLRIENLLLRGDGQVTQGRLLEETSLMQGIGGGDGGPGPGNGPPGNGPPGPGGGGHGVGGHHESGLGTRPLTIVVFHGM